jgi:hypothetical protein
MEDKKSGIDLTEEQIEHIADRVIDKFYERVGKSVIHKLMWAVGVVVFSLLVWLAGKSKLYGGP